MFVWTLYDVLVVGAVGFLVLLVAFIKLMDWLEGWQRRRQTKAESRSQPPEETAP